MDMTWPIMSFVCPTALDTDIKHSCMGTREVHTCALEHIRKLHQFCMRSWCSHGDTTALFVHVCTNHYFQEIEHPLVPWVHCEITSHPTHLKALLCKEFSEVSIQSCLQEPPQGNDVLFTISPAHTETNEDAFFTYCILLYWELDFNLYQPMTYMYICVMVSPLANRNLYGAFTRCYTLVQSFLQLFLMVGKG